jgi:hypothetical protein
MKQALLFQWIEAAEARSVCLLAEENTADATINRMPINAGPFALARLRRQLCLHVPNWGAVASQRSSERRTR